MTETGVSTMSDQPAPRQGDQPSHAHAHTPEQPPARPETEPDTYDVVQTPENAGKPRIDKPPLTADFPEDADFDHDPELQRVLHGVKSAPPKRARRSITQPAEGQDAPPPTDFIQPTFGQPVHWAAVGGALLLVALIATAVNAPSRSVWRVLLMLYQALLHTGTGVVAVYIAAALLRQYVGRPDLAAARMFAAVAAFSCVFALNLRLTGVQGLDLSIKLAIALACYVLLIAATFNLWRRIPLAYVVGTHLCLWLLVYVANQLSAAVAVAPAAAP